MGKRPIGFRLPDGLDLPSSTGPRPTINDEASYRAGHSMALQFILNALIAETLTEKQLTTLHNILQILISENTSFAHGDEGQSQEYTRGAKSYFRSTIKQLDALLDLREEYEEHLRLNDLRED